MTNNGEFSTSVTEAGSTMMLRTAVKVDFLCQEKLHQLHDFITMVRKPPEKQRKQEEQKQQGLGRLSRSSKTKDQETVELAAGKCHLRHNVYNVFILII